MKLSRGARRDNLFNCFFRWPSVLTLFFMKLYICANLLNSITLADPWSKRLICCSFRRLSNHEQKRNDLHNRNATHHNATRAWKKWKDMLLRNFCHLWQSMWFRVAKGIFGFLRTTTSVKIAFDIKQLQCNTELGRFLATKSESSICWSTFNIKLWSEWKSGLAVTFTSLSR